ncbi:MAG: DUF1275 domain-containing protein [Xanthobacteraceae bacterium]|nr:DUF1275 domain-containing protein [Xanthobacteraceae bacterium]
MKFLRHPLGITTLLAFNGGFVDTAGFLGLHGLFVAHVTGNFVTLGAALVNGSHGVVNKILALPEFIMVVALARLAGHGLRVTDLSTARILFAVKVGLLLAFFLLAVIYGPFDDGDSPTALLTGFAGIAAMAMQNAVQRVHMADMPPSTVMTGTTVQATMDAVDLLTNWRSELRAQTIVRFRRLCLSLFSFAIGCAAAALLYAFVGFWCLALTVLVGTLTAAMQPRELKES